MVSSPEAAYFDSNKLRSLEASSNRHGLAVEEAISLGLYRDFESRLTNFLFDSAGVGGWLPVIKAAFETLGADHICFATDYPYELDNPPFVKGVLSQISGLRPRPGCVVRALFGSLTGARTEIPE
jgi:hypothetical protein